MSLPVKIVILDALFGSENKITVESNSDLIIAGIIVLGVAIFICISFYLSKRGE